MSRELKDLTNAELFLEIQNLNKNISFYRDIAGRVPSELNLALKNVHRELRRRKREQIRKTVKSDKAKVESRHILLAVCQYKEITLQQLLTVKRDRATSYARHLVMYLCREHTLLSFNQIAILLNKKDHSTIHHGAGKIKDQLIKGCVETTADIQNLEGMIFREDAVSLQAVSHS